MGFACTRHRDRAFDIFKTVISLVLDFSLSGLLFHAGGHAAALNHEVINHAVKDGAIVMTTFNIGQKVGNCLGRFACIQGEGDIAFIGFEEYLRHFGICFLADYGLKKELRFLNSD